MCNGLKKQNVHSFPTVTPHFRPQRNQENYFYFVKIPQKVFVERVGVGFKKLYIIKYISRVVGLSISF